MGAPCTIWCIATFGMKYNRNESAWLNFSCEEIQRSSNWMKCAHFENDTNVSEQFVSFHVNELWYLRFFLISRSLLSFRSLCFYYFIEHLTLNSYLCYSTFISMFSMSSFSSVSVSMSISILFATFLFSLCAFHIFIGNDDWLFFLDQHHVISSSQSSIYLPRELKCLEIGMLLTLSTACQHAVTLQTFFGLHSVSCSSCDFFPLLLNRIRWVHLDCIQSCAITNYFRQPSY